MLTRGDSTASSAAGRLVAGADLQDTSAASIVWPPELMESRVMRSCWSSQMRHSRPWPPSLGQSKNPGRLERVEGPVAEAFDGAGAGSMARSTWRWVRAVRCA